MKKAFATTLIVALISIAGLWAWGIDADDQIDYFATLDSFSTSTVQPDVMPASLQKAIADNTSWAGSALVTVNKDGSPAIAFYDMKSVPGRNQVLYISGKIDKTTFDNLRKREDAMHVNLVYTDGRLQFDGPRTLLEYVDDRDDIRRLDSRTGGKNLYLEVEHMYNRPLNNPW